MWKASRAIISSTRRQRARRRESLGAILLLAAFLCGCGEEGFPRDAKGTLQRVRGGTMRVGLVENPPWVVRQGDEPAGIEPELVRQFAAELRATPEWHWGGEQAQMEALEKYELDLLLGGITRKTPWKSDVGLTSGYFEEHAFATAPGENGWIKKLDEFLHRHQGEIERSLRKAQQAETGARRSVVASVSQAAITEDGAP
jgi:polar amino acid transport system substrate-binding protein